MKKDIHPKYFPESEITCSCGNKLILGSTKESVQVEICSQCHPFFTGKQRLVDTARRVEKYAEKIAKKEKVSSTRKGKKVKKEKRAQTKKTKEVKIEREDKTKKEKKSKESK